MFPNKQCHGKQYMKAYNPTTGEYQNVIVDSAGRLYTDSHELNLYGESIVKNTRLLIQTSIQEKIVNDQQIELELSAGSTATANDEGNLLELIPGAPFTGATVAVAQSASKVNYRTGELVDVRFNVAFPNFTFGTFQQVGQFDSGDGFLYSQGPTAPGMTVGYTRGGRAHVEKLTITVAASGPEVATITLNDIAYNVNLTNTGGVVFNAYEISVSGAFGITWDIDHIQADLYFIAPAPEDRNGVYSFVSTGTAAGVFTTEQISVDRTEVFVPRSSWNGWSELVTTLDFTKLNLLAIEYGWYGQGSVQFKAYNPTSSRYELLHQIEFANQQNVPSISRITLPLALINASLFNFGPQPTLSFTAFSAWSYTGNIDDTKKIRYTQTNTTAIAANVDTVLISIRNKRAINNIKNSFDVKPSFISISCDGNKPVTFTVLLNPNLGNGTSADYASWNHVNQTQSVTLYDTNAITFTGGTTVFGSSLAKSDSTRIDLSTFDIILSEGDVLSVSAFSTNVSDLAISFNWQEQT